MVLYCFIVLLLNGFIVECSTFFAKQKKAIKQYSNKTVQLFNNKTIKPYSNKTILFLLAFFFLIRLIGITNPPLEIGHNWRQCLTNMVARNFLEIDANIFLPRIDIAGEKTGIMGAEFPLFNYLIYLASLVFGYEHWHGRWINLIVSTAGIYHFFLLMKELFTKKIAAYATLILTVSVWFDFSRKIMPDTFSVALVLIAFYHGFRYLKNGNWGRLALFFSLMTVGILSKLSALSLMSFLLIPVLIPQVKISRKIGIVVTSVVSVGLVGAWYFYWVPNLAEVYGYMLYFPRSFAEGAAEIMALWQLTLEKFYFSAFHSYVAFVCFLVGMYWTFSTPQPPPKGEIKVGAPLQNKEIKVDTLSSNKEIKVDTLSSNKEIKVDTLSSNKEIKVDTLSSNEEIKVDTLSSNKEIKVDTLSSNKEIKVDTLSSNKEIKVGGLYQEREMDASSSSRSEESPPLEGAGGWTLGNKLVGHFQNVRREKIFYLKIGIAAFALVFLLFMLKTGEVFPLHNYYIIPAVPLMALVAALFLANLKPKFALIILAAIAIEGIANQYHEFFIKESEHYKLTLESIADEVTQPTDLIILNDGSRNPQQMYFAHRKGWTVNQEDLKTPHIAQLQQLGASYLFINKKLSQEKFAYTVTYEDEYFVIYKL